MIWQGSYFLDMNVVFRIQRWDRFMEPDIKMVACLNHIASFVETWPHKHEPYAQISCFTGYCAEHKKYHAGTQFHVVHEIAQMSCFRGTDHIFSIILLLDFLTSITFFLSIYQVLFQEFLDWAHSCTCATTWTRLYLVYGSVDAHKLSHDSFKDCSWSFL